MNEFGYSYVNQHPEPEPERPLSWRDAAGPAHPGTGAPGPGAHDKTRKRRSCGAVFWLWAEAICGTMAGIDKGVIFMDKKQQIEAWIDGHREEFLEDLRALCRIRSVTGPAEENAPYGPGPAKALDKAIELCRGYGFRVQDHDRRVLTADCGPEDRTLDILAHLDVVDENTGWDSDPYEPVIRDDGYIYGRGVADDKGGAVAALYALRCVKELGLPMTRGVRLILGTDEECGSSDVDYYYRHNTPAPNTFTPDAEFPVGNAEKGMYRLRFRKTWERDTAVPRVASLTGGVQINAIPTEASAVIAGMEPMHLMAGAAPLCAELGATCRVEEAPGGAKLTVVGRGCHAAHPETGVNGNTVLLRVLTELPLADVSSTRALRELDRVLPHGDWLGKVTHVIPPKGRFVKP